MIVHNVANPSVSFGMMRRGGPKMPTEVTPDTLKELLGNYATKDELKITSSGVRNLGDLLTSEIEAVAKRVDGLESGHVENLSGQIRDLGERMTSLERSGVQGTAQSESFIKFISGHKVALGASAAALLAVGIATSAYSKHNQKMKAIRDAADPALYAPPQVNQVPQPAAIQAPTPGEPISSSVNDYFIKTA